jgi:hypothetical protein
MQSNPDNKLPCFGTDERLKEILTAIKFDITRDMTPQTAVNKHWRFIGV